MKQLLACIFIIATMQLRSATLPDFFLQSYQQYNGAVKMKGATEYFKFATLTSTLTDTVLREDFFRLWYFHRLFTNNSASDCSVYGALGIPYFWHWVTPNPRAAIIYAPLNQLLNKQKPPAGFEKYASWAMVDRTPALYLADLVTEKPQYYHPSCDSFYTFGWCSEREMAFVSLMGTYGYKGRIVFSGNHVWSEFLLKYNTPTGARYCTITADNTFNQFNFALLPTPQVAQWGATTDMTKMNKWYNDKATSSTERQKLKAITVGPVAEKRLMGLVYAYFGE